MFLMMKNLMLKYALVIFISILLMMILYSLGGLDPIAAFEVAFGAYPFESSLVISIFILFVFLLQSMNLENIKYTLDNEPYLMGRYGSRTKSFNKLLKVILLSNLIFVLLILVASLISMIIYDYPITFINHTQVVGIVLRGYVTCLIFSSIQVILLVKFKEIAVFTWMVIIAFVCIAITRLDFVLFYLFSILPCEISGKWMAFNTVFCIGILTFCILFARKEYISKEFI